MNGQLSVAGDGAANPGQLNRAIEKVSPLARHDTLICLITDGFGLNRDSRRLVTRLTQHNDVITALIYDPMERELPSAGLLTFTNGQGQLDVDTGNNHLRQNFAAGFDDRLEAIETLSRRYSIPVLSIDTVDDIARQIRDMIGQKHVALRR